MLYFYRCEVTNMGKMRSPNYPAISLPDAIEKARAIYNVEFTNAADPEVMIKDMGYTTKNGASLGVLSALKKYGLLDSVEGNRFKLSQIAFEVLEFPKASEDRKAGIETMYENISLFNELDEMYPDKIPSEENLRVTLIKKHFNPKVVHDLIQTYRVTREFVKSEVEAYIVKEETEGRKKIVEKPEVTKEPSGRGFFGDIFGMNQPQTTQNQLIRSITIPLSFPRNVTAQINIYGESFKPEDLSYLKKTIGEWEEQFTKESKTGDE
jgi:hypothetical protein